MLLTPEVVSKSSSKLSSTTTTHKAASIVSSVFRHASQFIEDRDEIIEKIKAIPQVQQSEIFYLFANATESLKNLAKEFVDSLIDEALIKVKKNYEPESELQEDFGDFSAQIYPKTKEAIDTRPSVFEMAETFVHSLLSEAKERADQIKLLGVQRFSNYNSVDDFKVKDGLEIVARCISKWSFNPNWYFKLIYNGRWISDTHSYFYTVRWSVPSLLYPVAQVTADIYFVIEVIPMTPPPVHIKVCYRLETDRSNRCALKSPFLEKWLHAVIRRKLDTFQRCKF